MKNTDKELLAQVDHFENQFVIQKELMEEMQHNLHQHEHALKRMVVENPELCGKMQVFKKLYGEFDNEFNQFLAKTM